MVPFDIYIHVDTTSKAYPRRLNSFLQPKVLGKGRQIFHGVEFNRLTSIGFLSKHIYQITGQANSIKLFFTRNVLQFQLVAIVEFVAVTIFKRG